MCKFSTKVNIPQSSLRMDYEDKVLTLGSCFAENIGTKLQNAYFLTYSNPFGVLYNPMSVGQSLRTLLSEKEFGKEDLFQFGSLWNSFAHSSVFSATTAEEVLQKINTRLQAARYFLNECNVLMITLGTAWIFEDIHKRKIVANCHKLPGNNFNRRRLSVHEIIDELTEVIGFLHRRNSALKIIFTVSPIRHWKDGANENTVSKSTLHLAVNHLVSTIENVFYFPAFEIVMDELRDYRFYASDMLHPSEQAVDYIWHRFSETYFSAETLQLKKDLEQLRSDLNHRPLHPDTPEYKTFLILLEKKKSKLIANHPFLKNRL